MYGAAPMAGTDTTRVSERSGPAGAEAADFVARFTETWADPSPERLNALLHPQGRLVQPLSKPLVGHDEHLAAWKRLFAQFPDLRAEVHDWAGSGELVFIEFTLKATIGGRPYSWPCTDRIRLEDGLVKERIAYFDPLPLVATVLRRPSAWPAFIRALR